MSNAKKHCLLVVDDEPYIADSVHDLLRHEFKVLRAYSAEEATHLLDEQEVHIVMTDQRMPQMTGVELLKHARVRHPSAVRMLFTGFADIEAIIAAINQGHIFGFLQKPWRPEEIEERVREAAREYDRIDGETEEAARVRAEVGSMRDRIAALEEEVRRLRAAK